MSVIDCLRSDFGYSRKQAAAIWSEFLDREETRTGTEWNDRQDNERGRDYDRRNLYY